MIGLGKVFLEHMIVHPRGLKVYREVCAGCHSMDLIAYRNLADLGFSEAHIKAIAAEYLIPMDQMMRERCLKERQFPLIDLLILIQMYKLQEQQNSAYPPDLSLIVKARPKGADYLKALLLGYVEAPDDKEVLRDNIIINTWMET